MISLIALMGHPFRGEVGVSSKLGEMYAGYKRSRDA